MSSNLLQNILEEPENRPLLMLSAVTGSIWHLSAQRFLKKQALLNLVDLLNLKIKEIARLLSITECIIQRRDSPSASEWVILILDAVEKGAEVFGNIDTIHQMVERRKYRPWGNKPIACVIRLSAYSWSAKRRAE